MEDLVADRGVRITEAQLEFGYASYMPEQKRVYVLWCHQYDDLEILGVFTTPERFKEYVAKRFPRMVLNSPWRSGESQWTLSTHNGNSWRRS